MNCERPSFSFQKATFCNPKDRLLQPKRPPFARAMVICWFSAGYDCDAAMPFLRFSLRFVTAVCISNGYAKNRGPAAGGARRAVRLVCVWTVGYRLFARPSAWPAYIMWAGIKRGARPPGASLFAVFDRLWCYSASGSNVPGAPPLLKSSQPMVCGRAELLPCADELKPSR